MKKDERRAAMIGRMIADSDIELQCEQCETGALEGFVPANLDHDTLHLECYNCDNRIILPF